MCELTGYIMARAAVPTHVYCLVVTSPVLTQRLSDLAWLRRVRDRIDREYIPPLDMEALARAHTGRPGTSASRSGSASRRTPI